jgi:hypothetical protein
VDVDEKENKLEFTTSKAVSKAKQPVEADA